MTHKIRFAGIPKNQNRRESIETLITLDHQELGGQTTGIDSVRMHNLVGEYLRGERAGKQQGRRARKTCAKPKEHSLPCYCLNLRKFQESQKESAA
jgi:hypothetical protein